ncbi:unnamed protein product [Adineta ricciae]|uniref:Uncharacterized protein n=1 Tax=Adineta ricciae TaxID=249248 RepID=A0A814YZA6_ADIRI|nr:unnamed protein product [Adineta ricciae]CAF1571482.1 unnamed protein product [Adineta ricciae]
MPVRQREEKYIEIDVNTNNSSYQPLDSNIPYLSDQQFESLLHYMGGLSAKTPVPTSLGNPGALGLAAFALTLFILSVFNAGSNLIDPQISAVFLPVALFYGGIAQFAAGMWEFQVNNTFGATVFSSYGAFWLSFGGYIYYIVPTIESTGKSNKATGFFLLAWFFYTICINVAAYKTSRLVFYIFIILNMTFLFLVVGSLANSSVVLNIGGWFGIATSFAAWYGSAALVINITWKKAILPVGVYQTPKEKSIED